MTAGARVGTGWGTTIIAAALVLALILLKRWRHLFTFGGALMVLYLVGAAIYNAMRRPRPYDVTITGRWAAWSTLAPPVAVLTVIFISMAYSLVPAGLTRTAAKISASTFVGLFVASQLYLATYHPLDIAAGICFAVAITVNAFRFFTPNEAFPVTYRGGKTAHLDVGGRRGDALRQAVESQLGLKVVGIKPVGLEGSGGSTPLRLQIEDGTYLFGKLYAMSHVRADRWYKLGRTILYGRLEDEQPFQTVRRFVEYEDYTARLLRDIGIPTAVPYGIVELTPEREYLFVTEFLYGAEEIGEADVDDSVIDQALAIVRNLWDAGLAHRDIKPANLMVRDGRVLLIDVFFVQVRPSPWRQAVDLANMMLVLAVRTDPERVYERALRYFTPDEIAEAFAAARGVASPTQLRTALKQDGRDLLQRFRALAPERRPIKLQHWNVRRLLYIVAAVFATYLVVVNTVGLLSPAYDVDTSGRPDCGTGVEMILMAQSVPSASSMPCLAALPAGWTFGTLQIRRGRSTFSLDSDKGGRNAVRVTLRPAGECTVAGATEVPSDEPGMHRYEHIDHLPPALRSTRTYSFPGGCITYRFAIDAGRGSALLFDADTALAMQARAPLVAKVRKDSDLRLCGFGAPACPGGED
jgi:tRNA A-37 threonylcarbamoyl transferase component Bud32